MSTRGKSELPNTRDRTGISEEKQKHEVGGGRRRKRPADGMIAFKHGNS